MLLSVKLHNESLDKKILNAMSKIDRRFFGGTYIDMAESIGCGQTISQPTTVARMLSLLELKKGDSVLEIGTGSGWNAALIAYLVYPGKVVSFERIPELAEKAKENIKKLSKNIRINLDIKTGNVFANKDKYEKIVCTAGILDKKIEDKIENMAKANLNENGILICPYASGPILVFNKYGEKLEKHLTNEEYAFVPLINDS